jgi:hypothetical protein
MIAIAHDGFDFTRWMHGLDKESRVRLDRFLELAAEAQCEGETLSATKGVAEE